MNNSSNDPDWNLDTYTFALPDERIAKYPASPRDSSRLMIINRNGGRFSQGHFADLADFLPGNALLVANSSRVIPARLLGQRRDGSNPETGAKVEFLALPSSILQDESKKTAAQSQDAQGWQSAALEGLIKVRRGPKPGEVFDFAPNLRLKVLKRGEFGLCQVLASWKGGSLLQVFEELGHMPLPPYLKRDSDPKDRRAYQTVYAQTAGSVAAPTAGLHFTNEVLEKIQEAGLAWEEIILHVGYGTFSPIRENDLRKHRMHEELIELSEQTALAVQEAKDQGRPVIAVGTTSARALEGTFRNLGKIAAYKGSTDIFLRPGSEFKVIDGLLTNFHLPKSSLLVLVCAFAGQRNVLQAYEKAIQAGYRFYSYGDAMLILPE